MAKRAGQVALEYLVIFIAFALLTGFAGTFFTDARGVLEEDFTSAVKAITKLR